VKHSLDQLIARGWPETIVPFRTAKNPEGDAVAMQCTACGREQEAVKGILIATRGGVLCFDHLLDLCRRDPRVALDIAKALSRLVTDIYKVARPRSRRFHFW